MIKKAIIIFMFTLSGCEYKKQENIIISKVIHSEVFVPNDNIAYRKYVYITDKHFKLYSDIIYKIGDTIPLKTIRYDIKK